MIHWKFFFLAVRLELSLKDIYNGVDATVVGVNT